MLTHDHLTVRNFAQIAEVDISFGDLTLLVGAQGTGKSLVLQWLKAALDGREIVEALETAGHPTQKPEVLVDLIFGAGMGKAWSAKSTRIAFNKRRVLPKDLAQVGKSLGKVFFVPAHRAMLISDGWAAPFQKLSSDTPVVARMFSQNLYDRFNARGEGPLFPLDRVFQAAYRNEIDKAVFHGGIIAIEEDRQHAKRLRLSHGKIHLPFMTWTAGQREFTPLLLGMHRLLSPRRLSKDPDIDWVIIEEPEMGLHPQAVTVVMLLMLELLLRGYRVVLSTHSPHVLTIIWMLRQMQENHASWKRICEAFGVGLSQNMQEVAKSALTKTYCTHYLAYESDGRVRSTDISSLDPGSDDERVAGWGGLTGFSSRFGEAVRRAVNDGET